MGYKGDVPSKRYARVLVWTEIEKLLACSGTALKDARPIFLASHTVADYFTLIAMGVKENEMSGVELDNHYYSMACCRAPNLMTAKRLLNEDVIDAVKRSYQIGENTKAVYLDFCNNLGGKNNAAIHCLKEVFSIMDEGSAVAVTFSVGFKDQYNNDHDRADVVLKAAQASSNYDINRLLTLRYHSNDENEIGAPMLTMLFYIGKSPVVNEEWIDLDKDTAEKNINLMIDLRLLKCGYDSDDREKFITLDNKKMGVAMKKEKNAADKAWETRRANEAARAEKAHNAAVKAWETRRKNAIK